MPRQPSSEPKKRGRPKKVEVVEDGDDIDQIGDPRDVAAIEALWDQVSIERCGRLSKVIEQYGYIRLKSGDVQTIKMHVDQRMVLAHVIRAWRSGKPARIWGVKARQIGWSTFVQVMIFICMIVPDLPLACGKHWCRVRHVAPRQKRANRAVCCANKRVVAQQILMVFRTAMRRLPVKPPTHHSTREEVVFKYPLESAIDVTSFEADDPGQGQTAQFLHVSELPLAKQERVENQLPELLISVPNLIFTLVIVESRAKGNTGMFHDGYWAAKRGASEYTALFGPWYRHTEYALAKLTDEKAHLLLESLEDEEEWLLRQTYTVRGRGRVKVSLEQIAWRRWALGNLCGGSLDKLHEQFPSTDEEAFLSSGRPVFDQARLKDQEEFALAPVFVGDIQDIDFKVRDAPKPIGERDLFLLHETVRLEDLTMDQAVELYRATGMELPVEHLKDGVARGEPEAESEDEDEDV